ncbi:MAG: hypothetical protein MJA30_03365 [Cytophagales bacterium]|nr:hypothetical protein [Cytophagales bacterium]
MTSLFKEFKDKFKKGNKVHFSGYFRAFLLFQKIDRISKSWLEDEDLEPPAEFIN